MQDRDTHQGKSTERQRASKQAKKKETKTKKNRLYLMTLTVCVRSALVSNQPFNEKIKTTTTKNKSDTLMHMRVHVNCRLSIFVSFYSVLLAGFAFLLFRFGNSCQFNDKKYLHYVEINADRTICHMERNCFFFIQIISWSIRMDVL